MPVPQEKILAFLNRGFDYGEQTVEGWECSFTPFPIIKAENNLVMLNLSSTQWVQLVSSIMVGAEWAYPDQSHQILWNFIKAIHCPPLMTEQECFEYPTYASFIAYSPENPYIDPDFVPDGYLIPPFIINGENGVDLPDYEHFDVITPFGAFEFLGNWFDIIDGFLPQITVAVQGAGKVYIKLLTVFNGGLAVITLDAQPNLIDIFGGIVTGAENILDLNLDSVSIPPETAKEVIYELDVVGTGLHTIYITFLPVIDDASIPLRYGGGFRGVQLCNFVELPTMGIQNIRFDGGSCELQVLDDGVWTQVTGWEDWLSCVPSGGGGGGGGITVHTFQIDLGSNPTTTSTSFVQQTATIKSFTPTRSKMLVEYKNVILSNVGNALTEVELRYNAVVGSMPVSARHAAATASAHTIVALFEGLDIGVAHDLSLYWKVASSTATMWGVSRQIITVIEFDDISELGFVEDIRIFEGELQKKIGGAWTAVSDSFEAIIDALQADINTAQTTADGAVTTNASQASQITALTTASNSHETRLDALEPRMDDAELSIIGLNASLGILDSRVDVTEQRLNGLDFGGVWAWYHDMTIAANGYALTGSAGGAYSAGNGWPSDSNGLEIEYTAETVGQNQVNFVQVTVRYTSAPTGTPQFKVNGGDYAPIEYNGVGVDSYGWYIVPNTMVTTFELSFAGSGNFYLRGVRYLGRGTNLPFD